MEREEMSQCLQQELNTKGDVSFTQAVHDPELPIPLAEASQHQWLPEVSSVRTELEPLKKLLPEKQEAMLVYIKELSEIADVVDNFHKGATIATVTGASVSAAGSVMSIVGLVLTPFTLGASLIVTALGAGVAVAGGVTQIVAGVTEVKSNSTDIKNVQKILTSCSEDLKATMKSLEESSHYIKSKENSEVREQLSRELEAIKREFFNVDLRESSKSMDMGRVSQFVGTLTARIKGVVDEIIRAGAAVVARAGARAAAGTAAKAAGIAGAVFLPLDVYDIAKNSIHLHEGATSELAAKIREIVATLKSLINMSHQDMKK